jgi:hypothetical protein
MYCDDCENKIEVYKIHLGEDIYRIIYGLPSDENGYIHIALGYKMFEDNKTKINDNFEKVEVGIGDTINMESLNDRFCRDKRPKPTFDGLEIDDWIEETKANHLRIGDISKFKHGEKIKVLVMDRNLYDTLYRINNENQLYKATDFFRESSAIYEHDCDLKGKIRYKWQSLPEYNNNENDDDINDNKRWYDLKFHIEYKNGNWYPLENGILPANGEHDTKLLEFDHKWNDFPDNTRVGWRGPMMLWSNVENAPDVYRYES